MDLTFYIFASIVAILLISVISARGRQIADGCFSLADQLLARNKELKLIRYELENLRDAVSAIEIGGEPILDEIAAPTEDYAHGEEDVAE